MLKKKKKSTKNCSTNIHLQKICKKFNITTCNETTTLLDDVFNQYDEFLKDNLAEFRMDMHPREWTIFNSFGFAMWCFATIGAYYNW